MEAFSDTAHDWVRYSTGPRVRCTWKVGAFYNQAPNQLQLRSARPDHRGEPAPLHGPLFGMPTAHGRRDQQPGALPTRANHIRPQVCRMAVHGREPQRHHFPFLPELAKGDPQRGVFAIFGRL